MGTPTFPLNSVRVAVPCHASWADMPGDERVRFCAACRQHVYNLSALDRAAAEALVRGREGRLCVRFYQRPDGTVITRDCRAEVHAFRRWLAGALTLLAGLFLAIFLWIEVVQRPGSGARSLREIEPFRTVLNWLDPSPSVTMGEPCLPPGNAPPAAAVGAKDKEK
jgi:hypothetical protein